MKHYFKDKVIIITGASSGIGKALAMEFSKQEAKVVIAARRIEIMEKIKESLKNEQMHIVKTDVSKEADCKNLIESSVNRFGKIDVLINNAGISMRALFVNVELHVLKKVMDTNFWGAVYCTKYALPHLLKSKGSVVGISSIAGYTGLPARSGYSASKFAMQGFLEVLRTENLKTGLHVLIACPGFTSSNIRNTALKEDGSKQKESPRDESRMMGAESVAKKIVRATQKRKNTLILTTTGKATVLLNKFFPNVVKKITYKALSREPDSPFK